MWSALKALLDGARNLFATTPKSASTSMGVSGSIGKRGKMDTGKKGLDLIKESEGLYLKKYLCPAGKWTIGYGHLWHPGDEEEITEEEADQLLDQDVVEAEVAVNSYVSVPLTQEQFDALVSFTMNLGSGALHTSTLLRLLNQKDYDGAAGQFGRWVYGKVNGEYKVLPGLVKRREKERKLFKGE